MALLVCTLLVALTAASKPQPEVTTPSGTFRGKTLTSHRGADYVSFRGIPYALPPTGDRRFALPVPHPVIKGVHDAGEFGSICLQHWKGLKLGQEDCLYLNVYTPLNRKTTANAGLKKVLVFIHGGGFVVGSSNPYMPGDLVTRGDLVVVTVNYRLAWMGFLRGNSSSLPGNVAYWDQLLALKWVRDNIRHFGGDPSDVTLSGESAGSVSASILALSQQGKDLFSKVILLSGAAPVYLESPHTSNNHLQIAADKFGCSVGSLSGNEDAVVACLKQVPAEDFIADFDFLVLLGATSSGDDLIPRPLSRAMTDLNFLSDTGFFDRDYLVSITADDGHIMVNAIFGKVDTTSLDTIVQGLSWFLHLPEDVIKSVVLEYQKLFGNFDKSVTAIITDAFFLNRSLNFLDTYRGGQKNEESVSERQAYLMVFDHIPKYVPNQYVLHALDLSYLFDLTPKNLITSFYFLEPEDVFYDEDREMKDAYIDLIADFVKTGNPGVRLATEKGVLWASYDPDRKSYLSLSLHPFVGEDLLGDRRVIWEKLVPQWLEEEGGEERVEEGKAEL